MGHSKTLHCTVVLLFTPLATIAALESPSQGIDRIRTPADGLSAISMVLAPARVALRDELEISDLQFRRLQDLEKAYMKRSMEISRKMILQQDNFKNPAAGAMNEMRSALEEVYKNLEKVLRPEQFRRLMQLHLQYVTQRLSLEPLARNSVLTELDLPADERIRFAREVKSRREVLKKMNIQLTEGISKTLDGLVPPEQRQKLADLSGEPVQTVEFATYTGGNVSNSTRGKGISRLLVRVLEPSIRKELEVLDDQGDQLSALYEDNRRAERNLLSKRERERVQAIPRGLPEIGPPDKELAALREQYDIKVAGILVPPQVTRLRQLEFQYRVRGESHIPLLSKTAANAIGLTAEKVDELQEAYLRESAVVRQEMDRLYYQALGELIGSLSIDQQKRYHLLVGKRFDKWYE
ncbi:MAG: hypothetical protein O3C40_03200 [Planctomycetota bacterium]|nr:hypothetical protein [Planctomycetota bacterium]